MVSHSNSGVSRLRTRNSFNSNHIAPSTLPLRHCDIAGNKKLTLVLKPSMQPSTQTDMHLYGEVRYDEWYQLYGHRNSRNNNKVEELCGYEIMFHDNKDKPYTISGIRSSDLKSKYEYSNIGFDKFADTHLMLASAFPHIEPDETVDHMNDDPTDNRITNLRWMSRRENSIKGQAKSVHNAKLNGGRNGRWIDMFKTIDSMESKIGCFKSVDTAAKFIIAHWPSFRKRCDQQAPGLKTVAAKIRRSLQDGHEKHKPYGVKFRDIPAETIEGETWVNVPHRLYPDQQDGTYKVSSKGRFKGPCGIAQQVKNRNGSKYMSIQMGKRHYVHRVVWESFHGPLPDGYEILHDDTAPLNPDGSYRNHLEDLRLGTRSENMREFHASSDPQLDESTLTVASTHVRPNTFAPGHLNQRCSDIDEACDDEITRLMKCPPKGIQYCKATEKRGSKYVISRKFTPEGVSDISSTGSKAVSDRDKFIQIWAKYQTIVTYE